MANIPEIFGSMVFNEAVMQERLPKDIYKLLMQTLKDGSPLELSVANVIASAMRDWAIEKGATHYTHWFQPLNGITAEKHDSFIEPDGEGGVIMEFNGKELVKGEPDASSFPSGGLRATFEARGYTAWDPSSYAFVKDGTLCIPTAFCSYTGEALDKKTPLLRSMEAINKQTLRILRLFGNTTATRVNTTVGAEQEYFLVDKKYYDARKDLKFCGRTLFGSMPPKGQEMEDHYFGAIKPRIVDFMQDLDEELWKHGILSKTRHNEAAPAQHEMAPIFTTTNLSADQNQLTMELMKKVGMRHGLACLLHEKPFNGVNGSGKHNNWSLSTNEGVNLLEPGDTPRENAHFLLILAAVIKAVDEHQDLLRICVASASNDRRLGGYEAPPAIISMYLGDELQAVLDSIVNGTEYDQKAKQKMTVGASVLPAIPKDSTDRNRTSPFAFTGNKFEFRSVGSSQSISGPNTILNTIVADSLCQFADVLEQSKNFDADLEKLIKDTLAQHKRIIFNGNGYGEEWIAEAEKRGLLNLPTLPDAMKYYLRPQNIEMFQKFGVYSEIEMKSHQEIKLDTYCKRLNIEVNTMVEMLHSQIIPAVYSYMKEVAETAYSISKVIIAECSSEKSLLKKMSSLVDSLASETEKLEKLHNETKDIDDVFERADFYAHKIIPVMETVRTLADQLETQTSAKYWPFPTYTDLLFRI